MKLSTRYLPLLCLLSFGIFACGPAYLYEESHSLEDNVWSYGDSLHFTFTVSDTQQIYNLYLEVAHSPDYAYQNLYTRIHTRFPNGEQLSEPLSLQMADQVGRWFGDCNQSRCQFSIPIQQGAFFNQSGSYQVMVEQFMREDNLTGISEIGFKVEPTEARR